MRRTLAVGIFAVLQTKETEPTLAQNYKDATYIIEGREVQLTGGFSEISLPETNGTIITEYFGNELYKDINNDGREDVVFLVTQNAGGTGTFFYVLAALNTENGYRGSHALLIGDRIAPQTTTSGEGRQVIVNYADRNPDEPFSTKPSIGKSIWLLFDEGLMQFGEVVQNFEGEADPNMMTLQMKEWIWKENPVFKLTFSADGRIGVTTDCNAVGGSYEENGTTLIFKQLVSTKKYCQESDETTFLNILEKTTSYQFTSKGELILNPEGAGFN